MNGCVFIVTFCRVIIYRMFKPRYCADTQLVVVVCRWLADGQRLAIDSLRARHDGLLLLGFRVSAGCDV